MCIHLKKRVFLQLLWHITSWTVVTKCFPNSTCILRSKWSALGFKQKLGVLIFPNCCLQSALIQISRLWNVSSSGVCRLWLSCKSFSNYSPTQPLPTFGLSVQISRARGGGGGGNTTGMPQLWLKEMLTSLRLQEKQALGSAQMASSNGRGALRGVRRTGALAAGCVKHTEWKCRCCWGSFRCLCSFTHCQLLYYVTAGGLNCRLGSEKQAEGSWHEERNELF